MKPEIREKQIFTIREIKDTFKKTRTKIKSTGVEFPPLKLKPPETSVKVNTAFFEEIYKSSLEKIKELFVIHGNRRSYLGQIKKESHWARTPSSYGRETKGSHWTEKEKELFLKCLMNYGKNWEIISLKFPNKTVKQLRNFFQNNKDKLNLNTYLKRKY